MLGKILIGLLVAAGLFLVYSLLSGSSAEASTGGSSSAGMGSVRQFDQTGKYTNASSGTFRKYDPSQASGMTSGIVGAVEKITGSKVLGFSSTVSK